MNREAYIEALKAMNARPPDKKTPKGQKFHIGEIVKIATPGSWFSQMSVQIDSERLYQIEYSYKQKFGGSDIKSYSLKHLFEDNSSCWYDESELELVSNP